MLTKKPLTFFLSFLFIVTLASFISKNVIQQNLIKSNSKAALFDVTFYEIPKRDATAMIAYFSGCRKKCKEHVKLDRHKDRKESILKELGITDPNAKAKFVQARYRIEDESRYQKINNNKDTVAGSTTEILRVDVSKTKKGVAPSYRYFDICTVCPPPTDCDAP